MKKYVLKTKCKECGAAYDLPITPRAEFIWQYEFCCRNCSIESYKKLKSGVWCMEVKHIQPSRMEPTQRNNLEVL